MMANLKNFFTLPNIIKHAPRIFFGLIFLLSDTGKLAVPAETMQENYGDGAAFMQALRDTGYLFTLLALTQIVAGLALILNFYVPLALVILAPVTLIIVAHHMWVDVSTQGYIISALLLILHFYLAHQYRQRFLPLLQARSPLG